MIVVKIVIMVIPIFIPSKYPFCLLLLPSMKLDDDIANIGINSFRTDIILGFSMLK